MNDNKLVHHVREDGRQEWRLNGWWHREDGPAVIWPDGGRAWYQNGILHREDGPAVICYNGTQEWWVEGQQMTRQEFELHRFRRWAIEGELI
jgi:hypothetical protein